MIKKLKKSLNIVVTAVIMFSSTLLLSGGLAHASAGLDCPNQGYTACIDTTTAYGPLLLVFAPNGTLVYSTSVPNLAVCTVGTSVTRNYDSATHVMYGLVTSNVTDFTVGNTMPSCGGTTGGAARLTQTQMDYFRWYANTNGVTQVLTRM